MTESAMLLKELASVETVERQAYHEQFSRPYLLWQLEQFEEHLGNRILEVGCGAGSILDLLQGRELLWGLDILKNSVDFTQRRFSHRNEMATRQLDVSSASDAELKELAAQKFDTVVCINVLEHIRDDLRALQAMEKVLVPGGKVNILVPAHYQLYGNYDKLDGHYRRYTKRHLEILAESANLKVCSSYYFNFVGALGWWLQYKVLNKTVHGGNAYGLMNKLTPFLKRIEKIIRPPLGLSLILTCQKKS